MIMNVIMMPAKAGCVVYDEMEPDRHPPHCQPLAKGVYGWGVYRAKFSALLGCNNPGALGESGPLSSHIFKL